MIIEATVAAIMATATNEVWPVVRDKISRVLRPIDPAQESANLDRIATTNTDGRQREAAFEAYLKGRIKEEPQRAEALSRAVAEVRRIVVNASGQVSVDAPGGVVHVHGGSDEKGRWPDYLTLTAMDATRAAQALEEMPRDDAIARLWAMQTEGKVEVAARRMALMESGPAAELVSMMDETLAANLLGAMMPPHPVALFVRIEPARAAAILEAMQEEEQAVTRMAELSQTDSDRAALVLYMMDKNVAARLLASMDAPYPAEVFKRMAPDRASAVLATMETEPAARRVAEMDPDRAALLLSKMDKISTIELLRSVSEPLSADLLARMALPDGAEVLAKVEPTWALERMAKIKPISHAVDLLVALRPPRTLLHEVDGTLAASLLREAVSTLARLSENRALLESAQAEAIRIIARAEDAARQVILDAETRATMWTDTHTDTVREPVPTLADRILLHLQRYRGRGQTLAEIAAALQDSEEAVRRELNQMLDSSKVRVSHDRGGNARYTRR